ncbi:MAG: HDOD domain-containing protein [Desulfuromonas sp.]|nr:HDOD domain-containing protein [Desulfuromonas sp.]
MHNSVVDSIRKIKQLPPPSGLSREIIRIVADDQVDLVDLVSIINKSPSITARILRCANSAYYGQRGEITTVREAIIRVLGLGITRSLSLAMALTSTCTIQRGKHFDSQRYWFNAVTTANIAQGLSHYLLVREKPAPATAYTTGLIHNIGLQALVHCFPDEMEHAFASTVGTLRERIHSQLGIDHHQTSALLSQSWDLPESITQALTSFEVADEFSDNSPLVQLIWLSSQLSDNLYLNKPDPLASLSIPESLIATDHVQKVVADIKEQLEGLHEMAQLITAVGGHDEQ